MVVVIGKVLCFTCLLRVLSKIYSAEKQKTQPTMSCSFKCMWGNSTIKSSLVHNWGIKLEIIYYTVIFRLNCVYQFHIQVIWYTPICWSSI